VALVGFDDIPLADAVSPGVTVVAQDPGGSGGRRRSCCSQRLDGFDGPSRRIELPTRLIARGRASCRLA
jgi:LacI family transcriptional regulator